ncbi:hypothetical protein LTR75_001617 [Friedmanniomyces endolithicus]|nr:hypothetical protein LTR75_001617 [Friedmanniomyces endolithicus]
MSSYTNDGGASAAQNTNAMDPVGMNSEKAEAARQKSAEVMAALKEGKPGEADATMGKRDDMDKGPSVIDRMKKKIGVGGEKKGEGDVAVSFVTYYSCRFLAANAPPIVSHAPCLRKASNQVQTTFRLPAFPPDLLTSPPRTSEKMAGSLGLPGTFLVCLNNTRGRAGKSGSRAQSRGLQIPV